MKKFKTIEEAKEWGKTYFGNWLKDFQVGGDFRNNPSYAKDFFQGTDEEWALAEAVAQYCGNTYVDINRYLRTGYCPRQTEYFRNKIMEYSETLQKGISELEIPEDIMVYRCLDLTDFLKANDIKFLKRGDVLQEKGFLSTALVKDIIMKDMQNCFCMEIYVPAGAHGVYMDLISNRPEEQEVLFNPCKLEVVEIHRRLGFGRITKLVLKML